MRAVLTRRRAMGIGLTGVFCIPLAPVGRPHAESRFIRGPIPNVETMLPLSTAIPSFVTTDPQIAGIGTEIARSIAGILERSGGFKLVDSDDVDDRDVGVDRVPRFSAWASRDVDILVTGAITRLPDNRLRAMTRVWKIRARQQIFGLVYFARDDNSEAFGQAIAGEMYERLGGHQR
jgi:Tol biopolymer transport system component